ncbi:MAG: chemotaxis protein CheA [Oligoflexia bacterium]|nr:chemotaxis protein CheA [Oligoflexia bacterium]
MTANMVSESDVAFIEEFVVESFDILEDVEPQVVSSECLNKTLANNIFRLVHSIKGAAGFLRFNNIAKVSHSAENILTYVRSNDRDYSDIGVDFLIRVFDFFRKTFIVIKKEYTDDSFKDDALNLVAELDKIMSVLNGKSVTSSKPVETKAAAPVAPAAPASATTTTTATETATATSPQVAPPITDIDDLCLQDSNQNVEKNAEKNNDSENHEFDMEVDECGQNLCEKKTGESAPVINKVNNEDSAQGRGDDGMDDLLNEETFQIFCSEAKEIFEEAEQNLLEYSNNLTNNTLLLAIFRSIHTFKGNCGLFNLTKLATMGHKLESLLEKMIQNQIPINKELVELVIKLVDALKDGFNSVLENKHDEWNVDAYIDILDGVISKHGVPGASPSPTPAPAPTTPAQNPASTPTSASTSTGERSATTDTVTAATAAAAPTPTPAPAAAAVAETVAKKTDVKKEGNNSVENKSDDATKKNAASSSELNTATPTSAATSASTQTMPATTSAKDNNQSKAQSSLPGKIELKEKTDNKTVIKKKGAGAGGGANSDNDEGGADGNKSIKFDRKDIRIEITKLDWLNDLVGELLIAKTMIYKDFDFSSKNIEKKRSFHFFSKVLTELQDVAMSMRMIPISSLFKKMLRIVHDLENKTKKRVKIDFWGESTEVDKTVIEHINDPLLHILRNAVDHGIELPEERVKSGKSEHGIVRVGAVHEGGEVRIIISDDGNGLSRERIIEKAQQLELIHGDGHDLPDSEVYKFIFAPGFSTAKEITDISGRGVGMDVVIQNVRKMNGRVDVASVTGKGTTFTIRIPLTLAIIEGMLVSCGGIKYTIPLESIRETIKVKNKDVSRIMQGQELIKIRDVMIPIVRLHNLHKIKNAISDVESGVLIVVEGHGRTIAILVDQLIGQYQTIIKSLPQYLNVIEINNFKGISGCSIQGDGEVGLILDIGTLVELVEGSLNYMAA